jgi:Fe-S cluster biosynthesis and repair protein YggX
MSSHILFSFRSQSLLRLEINILNAHNFRPVLFLVLMVHASINSLFLIWLRSTNSIAISNSETANSNFEQTHLNPPAVACTIVPVWIGSGTQGRRNLSSKKTIDMEPIRKRQKVANEQQRSFLIDQPDLFLEVVVSFWDFQSLLAFRQTNHRFKRIVEEDLKRRSLESLPIDCNDEDYDHGRFDRASLHLEWSEQFRDRDAVYEHALTRADPGGQVSLDADYDEDRARYLIHSRGWVDVEDFLGDSDADTAEEDYYCSEIGWKVSASFRSISPEKKWNIAKAILINEDGVSMFEDYEANRKFLRQCAFGLLLDAQPSSLRHTCAKYRYRHTDYPAGGKEEALLFLTSDGTQVQLKGSTDYENH